MSYEDIRMEAKERTPVPTVPTEARREEAVLPRRHPWPPPQVVVGEQSRLISISGRLVNVSISAIAVLEKAIL